MDHDPSVSRRTVLRRLALGLLMTPVAAVRLRSALAAEAALLSVEDPQAKAVKYVEDAHQARDAQAGNTCANCALYQGTYGSSQGPCQLFKGKDVKAAGWCSSWAPQM